MNRDGLNWSLQIYLIFNFFVVFLETYFDKTGLKNVLRNPDIKEMMENASFYLKSLHDPSVDCAAVQDVVESQNFIAQWQNFILNPKSGYKTVEQVVEEIFRPGGLAGMKLHVTFTAIEVRKKYARLTEVKQEIIDLFKDHQVNVETDKIIKQLMLKAEVTWSIPPKFSEGDEAEFYVLLNQIGAIIDSFYE